MRPSTNEEIISRILLAFHEACNDSGKTEEFKAEHAIPDTFKVGQLRLLLVAAYMPWLNLDNKTQIDCRGKKYGLDFYSLLGLGWRFPDNDLQDGRGNHLCHIFADRPHLDADLIQRSVEAGVRWTNDPNNAGETVYHLVVKRGFDPNVHEMQKVLQGLTPWPEGTTMPTHPSDPATRIEILGNRNWRGTKTPEASAPAAPNPTGYQLTLFGDEVIPVTGTTKCNRRQVGARRSAEAEAFKVSLTSEGKNRCTLLSLHGNRFQNPISSS